jgi:hypothetical protein
LKENDVIAAVVVLFLISLGLTLFAIFWYRRAMRKFNRNMADRGSSII